MSEPDASAEPTPTQPTPEGAPASEIALDGDPGPYRNLLVPLVVVPFLVVGVLVLVFVFFGAIRGRDATIAENLEKVVEGGSNERQQAAMSLAAQVSENVEAEMNGRDPVWVVEPGFLDQLQRAWERLPTDDNANIRLALAQLSAQFGDPGAFDKLAGFLALEEDDDPGANLRVQAMLSLSTLRDERAAEPILAFLAQDDPFLRQAAAGALQRIPGETSRTALAGLLDEPLLELRGQAAISLARLGDPRGAAVLRELVSAASYEAVRRAEPGKFVGDPLVNNARVRGLRALASLGLAEDLPLFERLASSDEPDVLVREEAMLALKGPRAGSGELAPAAIGADGVGSSGG